MINDKTRKLLNEWQLRALERLESLSRVTELPYEIGCGLKSVSLLAPLVVPACRVALLIVFPKETPHYLDKYDSLMKAGASLPSIIAPTGTHVVPQAPVLHLCSAFLLSKPEGLSFLEQLRPDLIITAIDDDESVRSRRLSFYLRNNEQAKMLRWRL